MKAGHSSSGLELFAGGLDNPRGLVFGPDGWLYVAEGGRGGSEFRTDATGCEQVPPPIGPYTGGPPTARISRISPDGTLREVVAGGLPSSQTSAASGGMVSGVASVAFVGGTLYALVAGAGCSHGLAGTTNALLRVGADGSTSQIADLSAYWRDHPAAVSDPDDAEPDGTPFAMIEARGRLYLLEAHGGVIDEVTEDGTISRFADLSAAFGHIVPTSLVFHEGDFYAANLHRFPVRLGAAQIIRISSSGALEPLPAQLTAVTGLGGGEGCLYAVESTTVEGSNPVAGTGRLVRVDLSSMEVDQVASGLTFPVGAAVGADGMIYLSNRAFGSPAGKGAIVRIAPPARP